MTSSESSTPSKLTAQILGRGAEVVLMRGNYAKAAATIRNHQIGRRGEVNVVTRRRTVRMRMKCRMEAESKVKKSSLSKGPDSWFLA